jgi:tryptophan 2,3-dioxygenase
MDVYYKDYLQLDQILNAQEPVSKDAHDEMLFIVIHQAYELWFKQILFEIGSVTELLQKPVIPDNSPDLYTINHRLSRVVTILRVIVQQMDIMETMTPLDFLDFRNLLRPASGFQSLQFKMVEARLGLEMEERHGQEYYISQLRKEDVNAIREVESHTSLLQLINNWLERMPFFRETSLWENYEQVATKERGIHLFWSDYTHLYEESLEGIESANLARFKTIFLPEKETESGRRFSPRASRNALFIMLYRDYPLFQTPYLLLNTLLEIDEELSAWRFRHLNMVHRIIGARTGTGGSTGKGYLKQAMDKHYIFRELAELTTFLIERRSLPRLPKKLEERLGFSGM